MVACPEGDSRFYAAVAGVHLQLKGRLLGWGGTGARNARVSHGSHPAERLEMPGYYYLLLLFPCFNVT